MRDKTEAAKVLLEAGWTFEEVAKVLEARETIVIRESYPWPTVEPWWQIPNTPPTRPPYPGWPDTITICSRGTRPDPNPYTVIYGGNSDTRVQSLGVGAEASLS